MMRLLSRNLHHKTARITVGGRQLNALVADSTASRAVGLMFREQLKQNECMLFIFGRPGKYGIWMRHMNFPIDVVWAGDDGSIVDIKEGLRPAKAMEFTTYYPSAAAKYVVELNSGFVKRNRISKNSAIKIGKRK